jgi:hypothetical protein
LPLHAALVLSKTMMMRAILPLIVGISIAGAASAQDQAPPPVKSCVPANPKLEWAIWPNAETSSSYADIAALERRMRNAADELHPAMLMDLGRLKSRLDVDPKYAAAWKKEFFYQELAGAWLYTGWHFKELLRRFPNHKFADDAAYELTRMPEGGECEGYVPCQVASLWMRLDPFLRKYPSSPYADSAVQRTLLAFSAIKPKMNLTIASSDIDPVEIRKHVNSLEHTANTLPLERRLVLLARVAELREQLGEFPRARNTARLIVDMRVGALSDCMAGHLRRLEWRLTRP